MSAPDDVNGLLNPKRIETATITISIQHYLQLSSYHKPTADEEKHLSLIIKIIRFKSGQKQLKKTYRESKNKIV